MPLRHASHSTASSIRQLVLAADLTRPALCRCLQDPDMFHYFTWVRYFPSYPHNMWMYLQTLR